MYSCLNIDHSEAYYPTENAMYLLNQASPSPSVNSFSSDSFGATLDSSYWYNYYYSLGSTSLNHEGSLGSYGSPSETTRHYFSPTAQNDAPYNPLHTISSYEKYGFARVSFDDIPESLGAQCSTNQVGDYSSFAPQVHSQSSPVEPKKQQHQSSKYDEKYSRKHQLPDQALSILNEWFDDHVNNPYPTLEEKEKLASKGDISVKQVNAWFSNRRNRSQNTKPKRMKRMLEKQITTIFNELVEQTNTGNSQPKEKEQLIAKFRNTLVNHDIGL